MARSAEDYGIYGLDDQTLAALAGDPRRYGEKSKYAGQEIAQRRGLMNQGDVYRAALEKAAYGDAGRQYGAGLGDISNYLARSGPLADSGAATALRAKLASQVYGAAQGRIGSGYADYLAKLFQGRNQFSYQKALMRQQELANKKTFWDNLAGLIGGAGQTYASSQTGMGGG